MNYEERNKAGIRGGSGGRLFFATSPLDEHGWTAMAAMLMGIHLNQLALMLGKGF